LQILPFLLSEIQKRKVEFLEELKNISTKRKVGKTTDELIVYFNENATETIQDRLTRIILKELRRKLDERTQIYNILFVCIGC